MSREYTVQNNADTTLVTTAEAVVATLAGVSMNKPGQRIDFLGMASVVTGTNTTSVVLRVREDSLTGTLVGETSDDGIYAAVGAGETRVVAGRHEPTGEISGKTYVLTVSQTGASANGSVTKASLRATVSPL